jgi:prevent-host-death family protein
MKRTNVAELKAHLSEYLRAAETGQTIEILVRDRPVARLVPLEPEDALLELAPAEGPFTDVRKLRFEPIALPIGSLEALRLERGER